MSRAARAILYFLLVVGTFHFAFADDALVWETSWTRDGSATATTPVEELTASSLGSLTLSFNDDQAGPTSVFNASQSVHSSSFPSFFQATRTQTLCTMSKIQSLLEQYRQEAASHLDQLPQVNVNFEHVSITGVVLSSAVLVLLFVIIRQRYFSSISDIPGPFLGTFGTCFQVWEIFKGSYSEDLTKLHEKYGPFVRISHNEVSVSHPEALQKVLAATIPKSNFYKQFAIPNDNFNNLMSECDPKAYSAMRSRFGAAYAMSNVLKNEEHVDGTIELMERRLDQLSFYGEPFELSKWLHFLTWDIMGDVTFSSRFGYLDQGKDVGGSIKNTFWLAGYVTIAGYMRWLHSLLLGNPILRYFNVEPNDQAYKTAVKSIAERKTKKDAYPHDMMSYWLGQHTKDPSQISSDHQVFCAVMGNIGAGGDTVGSALQSVFYYLIRENPIYMMRLKEELDTYAVAKGSSGVIPYADAKDLPYLQAVIKECLRLWPPVPWSLPRVVPKEGLVVAGRHFAPGTVLSVCPWVIHHSTQFFGPTARNFNPERWLAEPPAGSTFASRPFSAGPAPSTDVLAAGVKTMERFLIPFGLGYNVCPGRNLAMLELSKITATLFRDFDFGLDRSTESGGEWKYHVLFLTAQNGWRVKCKRRVVGSCARVAPAPVPAPVPVPAVDTPESNNTVNVEAEQQNLENPIADEVVSEKV